MIPRNVSSENHDSDSRYLFSSAEVDRVHWYIWELLWRPGGLAENDANSSGHAYDLAVLVELSLCWSDTSSIVVLSE